MKEKSSIIAAVAPVIQDEGAGKVKVIAKKAAGKKVIKKTAKKVIKKKTVAAKASKKVTKTTVASKAKVVKVASKAKAVKVETIDSKSMRNNDQNLLVRESSGTVDIEPAVQEKLPKGSIIIDEQRDMLAKLKEVGCSLLQDIISKNQLIYANDKMTLDKLVASYVRVGDFMTKIFKFEQELHGIKILTRELDDGDASSKDSECPDVSTVFGNMDIDIIKSFMSRPDLNQ